MSILDFVAEVKRQANLLDQAHAWDESKNLRQDIRRVGWTCDIKDAECVGDWDEWERLLDSPPRKRSHFRMGSRTKWFVDKFSRPPYSIDLHKSAALAEAAEQGTFNVVAPLIVALAEAHKLLIAKYEHQGDLQYFLDTGADWGDVDCRHKVALEELEKYIPTTIPGKSSPDGPASGLAKKRIKPIGDTVDVIRLIQAGRSNNEIVASGKGKSVSNIRKIRSTLNNDGYEI